MPAQTILDSARGQAEGFIAVRRDIHRHPELSFSEHRTSDLVATRLAAWGYEVERGLGGTGVVGQLRHGSAERSIGIRADMDALPLEETSGVAYSSRQPGAMHACGHDGHTAMLLGAAKLIAERRQFSGTVNLIFQPAEEYGKLDSGAARMISDGLFTRYPCDAIFGMHNMPGYPQGHLVFRDGPMMASSDKVIITLHGRGGHGSAPHNTADPVVAAASLTMALQTVVSRNVDPLESAVVTVGVLQAGTANNIIPSSARLEITVRSFRPEIRDLLQRRITEIAQAQATSFDVRAEVDYQRGYAPLINNARDTQFARDVAQELVGPDRIVPQAVPLAGSEDFAFMLEETPGCYLFIGNGDDDQQPTGCAPHSPGYDFNDANIAIGSAYWTLLTERFLAA